MSLRKHRTASKSQEFGTYKENTQRTSPQSALVAAALGSAQGRFLKCSLTPRFGFSESLGQLFCMNYLLIREPFTELHFIPGIALSNGDQNKWRPSSQKAPMLLGQERDEPTHECTVHKKVTRALKGK